MSEWTSADRKPDSNRRVLIGWRNSHGKGRTSIGFYAHKNEVDCSGEGGIYDEQGDRYVLPEGWYEDQPYGADDEDVPVYPVDVLWWRPVPTLPTTEEST